MDSDQNHRTIRELGGEVFAEAWPIAEAGERWELLGKFVDVMMGVLARHAGDVIVNDSDLPVEPLPRKGIDETSGRGP